MPQTFDTIRKSHQGKKFASLYLLHGDEPFYLDLLAHEIEENALNPADRGFNQFVLFGKDLNIASLLSHAKRFPMMAEKQLVLVKEAQQIQGLDSKEQIKFLEDYALRPAPTTILVLCFKEKADERKAWVKAFDKNGVLYQSAKLYDNKLPDWVADYCHTKGIKISRKAIEMLVEFIGNDLKRLANELEKILLNLNVSQEITAETIEKYVGISKDYNVFEFQKALLYRDVMKANRIANFFAANPKDNPLPAVTAILYNFFSKLLVVFGTPDKSEKNLATVLGVNPYFVKDYTLGTRNFPLAKTAEIIHYLRETDAKSKGVEGGQIDEGNLLKELVFKILH